MTAALTSGSPGTCAWRDSDSQIGSFGDCYVSSGNDSIGGGGIDLSAAMHRYLEAGDLVNFVSSMQQFVHSVPNRRSARILNSWLLPQERSSRPVFVVRHKIL